MPEQRARWWTDDPVTRNMFTAAGASSIRGLQSTFLVPRILMGAEAAALLKGVAVGAAPVSRALVVTDQVVKKLAGRTADILKEAGFTVELWDEALPEPPVAVVERGAAAAAAFAPGLIVAVGGGSVIDAAKVIWLKYERPDVDFRRVNPLVPLGLRKRALLVAVPTTAGTGSEATSAAVITDGPQKMFIVHPELVPDFAVLEPSFTTGMPPQLTACTGLDVLAHATGSYLSHWSNEFTETLALKAVELTFRYLPRAVSGGDVEARFKMQVAACMAGIVFSNSACGPDHAMGHVFGRLFGVHHGAAVGLFTPYMIGYVGAMTDRYLALADLLQVAGDHAHKRLNGLCRRYMDFIRSVGGPATIAELGVTREQLAEKMDALVEMSLNDGTTLFSRRPLTAENYRRLFEYAYDGRLIDF